MFTPYFTITPKITRDLEMLGIVFGYFQAIQIPENYKKEFVSKVTAEMVHASTAIEGNTLTEKQVSDVLDGRIITAAKQDITEIINYNNALTYIETFEQMTNSTIDQHLIQTINALILKDIRDDIAGHYRSKQVRVGDYIPPHYDQIPPLMQEFTDWLSTLHPAHLSPILYSGIAHYQLVAIHPFEDGNGRTTRVLTTLFLMQRGYDITRLFALESYYNRNRNAYYEALNSADMYRVDGKPDLTWWLEYYVEGMLIEAERAKSRIEELLQKSKILSNKIWISPTQRQFLVLTVKKGTAKMLDYIEISQLSRKGTYNAVGKLVDLGLLQRKGEKKGAYYTITEKGLEYSK